MHRYVASPIGAFSTSNAHFDHVYVDIVGSLMPSQGHTYPLTSINRFTGWAEVSPISTITADLVTRYFAEEGIALIGYLPTVTTVQGQQFESGLFCCISNMLGTGGLERPLPIHLTSVVLKLHTLMIAHCLTVRDLPLTQHGLPCHARV